MGQFKQQLDALAQGQTKPSEVKEWLSGVLDQGSIPSDELKADLTEAGELGLPAPILDAFRGQILAAATAAASGGDFELSLELEGDEPEAPAAASAPPPAEDPGLSLDLEADAPAAAPDAGMDLSMDAEAEALEAEATLLMQEAEPDATPPAPPAEDDSPFGQILADDAPAAPAESDAGENDRTLVSEEAADADATVVSGDDDATVVSGDDATAIMADDDATVRTGGGEMDPFAMAAPTSQPTGESWPTGTGWAGGQPQTGGHAEIGPGVILKQRFELMDKLGEGGMGAVWRARDLLKVEAQDKNPYVAVKLLSGDFKSHPEAFIALQRESSKAQKLAHPNIATVYDFDRDMGTVYMTMEVLKGQELNDFIKKTIPEGGLSVEEAMPMISQLCDGLAYAHDRGLVHSDFKPGNAFVGEDGTVKLLDFGIARASAAKTDAEGETTLFDPGQLGALTPAYATIEMFEGQVPDPRDDIYALACTAYELLNKTHPFKKRSAVKVKELGLKPEPLKKLTRRQNKILIKGLGLMREDRPATVEEFWENLRPRKDYTLHIAAAAIIGIGLIGALVYPQYKQFQQGQANDAAIALIQQGTPTGIQAGLDAIVDFPEDAQVDVINATRETLIEYYQNRAYGFVDRDQGRLEYDNALAVAQEALQYFPNDVAIDSLRRDLEATRDQLIGDLRDEFNRFTAEDAADRLMPIEGDRDLPETLAEIRLVDPSSSLLTDPLIVARYAAVAGTARAAGDHATTLAVAEQGLQLIPDAAELIELKGRADREIRRQADAALVAQLEQRLGAVAGQLNSLNDFSNVADDLIQLAELRPEHPLVARLQPQVETTVGSALSAQIERGAFAEAEDNLVRFARLLDVNWLMQQRDALSRAEIGAGWQPDDIGDRTLARDELRGTVNDLLETPEFTEQWSTLLRSNFRSLIAALRPGNEWIQDLRTQAADVHVTHAQALIEQDLYESAQRAMDEGQQYLPEYGAWVALADTYTASKRTYDAAVAQQQQIARIERLKGDMRSQSANGQATNAVNTFETLQASLPASDPFITTEGPNLIARAYLDAAVSRLTSEPTQAITLARTGQRYANLPEIQQFLERADDQVRRGNLLLAASNATAATVARVNTELAAVMALFQDEASAIQARVHANLAARIRALSNTDLEAAHALKNAAMSTFGNPRAIANVTLQEVQRPSQYAAQIRSLLGEAKLTEAETLLNRARSEEGQNHYQLTPLATQLNSAKSQATAVINDLTAAVNQGAMGAAQQFYSQAMQLWVDNPNLAPYASRFGRSGGSGGGVQRAADGSVLCSAGLAGLAGSAGARAACYDMISGNRGPQLVVVPAGGGNSQPFAIGRTEVSIGDFNEFCRASGQCAALGGNAALPATGISFTQAQAYVDWLSVQTGKRYRIPSRAEWVYAASAGAPNANDGEYNCRFEQGGTILRGAQMLDAETGRPNGWGLINSVGNAQEFVRASGGVEARGGAYPDSMSVCGVDLAKGHSGAGDDVTGLRIARDID